MAIIKNLGAGYETDPIRDYAAQFNNTVKNICESTNMDFYSDTSKVLRKNSAKAALENFFVQDFLDESAAAYTPSERAEILKQHKALLENDLQAMQEASSLGTINAMVGMTLPMHKNILMNNVWDKGGIPKKTAEAPIIARTMEIRNLVKPDGTKIDMFLNQNAMTKAMLDVNPIKKVQFDLPESYGTEIVTAKLGGGAHDHINKTAFISAVKVKDVAYEIGDTLPGADGFVPTTGGEVATKFEKHDTWFKVRLKFGPGYGEVKKTMQRPVRFDVKKETSGGSNTAEIVTIDEIISANIQNDRLMAVANKGQIAAIELSCKLDASQRTIQPCSVSWEEITDTVEIDADEGIAAGISPEEAKDIDALYNINQTTKLMSLMKTAMGNRRDDMILNYMNESYEALSDNARAYGSFDFAPRAGYLGDHIEWRHKTFWDWYEDYTEQMVRVLNDPNVVITCYAEPMLVKKIVPTDVKYTAPSNIGPVQLDYTKTVVSGVSNKVYNFIGSDKLRNNSTMIVTLVPRNTNRIIYIIYDYQFFISNEIRNAANPALPQIYCFDRWLMDEYQPVQGHVKIAHPSGIRQSDNLDTTTYLD